MAVRLLKEIKCYSLGESLPSKSAEEVVVNIIPKDVVYLGGAAPAAGGTLPLRPGGQPHRCTGAGGVAQPAAAAEGGALAV